MTAYSDAHADSIWLYPPSLAAATVFAVLYFIPTAYSFFLTVLRYRSWFFLCVLVGGVLEVGGYVARAVSVENPDDVGPYAASTTLIILAPIFVAAGNYLLIGRLTRAALAEPHQRIFGVAPARVTKIFVGCDIVSFLVQAGGSGVAASGNWEGDDAKTGEDILLAGLATQVATFVFFVAMLLAFHRRVALVGERTDSPRGWRKVRSIYRLVEFAQGIDGYTFTHEWVFYVLEAGPMLPAIAVFCFFHPAKYLGSNGCEAKNGRIDFESMTGGAGASPGHF